MIVKEATKGPETIAVATWDGITVHLDEIETTTMLHFYY
jgi:hypothetical protein